jgi:hypothetical protein
LEEVANVLRKVNLDKKAADRASGKREHDFFMAKGSKILVSSYVHMRKEGLEGYINDFNDMVKKVQVVTGNSDIEILPVVPVVREGMDQVGRELLAMVREWVEWIGVKSGRESVKRLSGTAGWGVESDGREATFIWKPSFQMKVSEGNSEKVRGGSKLVEGDRMESTVRAACVTKEMVKMMGGDLTGGKVGGKGGKGGEEVTNCEKNGISVEGEFVFSRAVGEFLREEVRAGTFKGNYRMNLREQMRMRSLRENADGEPDGKNWG